MSLFEWFLKGPRFRKHQDTYALTRSATIGGLIKATHKALELEHQVVWLCHFESTFVELEEALLEAELNYEVLAHAVNPDQLSDHLSAESEYSITLTMSGMLDGEAHAGPMRKRDGTVSVMVGERHPLIDCDEHLARFCENVPSRISIGYFVSLEDPVVAHFISPTMVQILENLGMGSHDLISSHMLTKSINKSLSKLRTELNFPVQSASSPQEWLSLNAGIEP